MYRRLQGAPHSPSGSGPPAPSLVQGSGSEPMVYPSWRCVIHVGWPVGTRNVGNALVQKKRRGSVGSDETDLARAVHAAPFVPAPPSAAAKGAAVPQVLPRSLTVPPPFPPHRPPPPPPSLPLPPPPPSHRYCLLRATEPTIDEPEVSEWSSTCCTVLDNHDTCRNA